MKLARKFANKKRAKRQLAGLYEVLKPGSFVTKSSPTTTIIKEPGRAPVKVRDSDLKNLERKRSGQLIFGPMNNVGQHPTSKPLKLRPRGTATI